MSKVYGLILILFVLLSSLPAEAQIGFSGGGRGGVTGWPTVSTNKEITWADALADAMLVGNGTNAWAFYNDPSDGLQFVCVVADVANDCNYIRKLAASKYFEIQNSSGTSIFRVTENTGAVTNMTLDGEGSGNTITLTEEQWWDVAACQNTTASLVWDVPTANSPAATCDTGSNTQKGYAAFDAATDESFEMN